MRAEGQPEIESRSLSRGRNEKNLSFRDYERAGRAEAGGRGDERESGFVPRAKWKARQKGRGRETEREIVLYTFTP